MPKKFGGAEPSLLDLMLSDEDPARCLHPVERMTETVWPELGPGDPRMTWTCDACGRVRGRMTAGGADGRP